MALQVIDRPFPEPSHRVTREEIIAANPLPRFLAERGYELRPVGRNFVTDACPVVQHNKHHRCVTIDTEKNLWHCNDCDRGGTVIEWVMLEQNVTAADAKRMLGGKRNSSKLPNNKSTERQPRSDKKQFVCAYDYTDENGQLLFQCVRFKVPPPKKKTFQQRRPDGKGGWIWNIEDVRRVLYRLPEVLKAQGVCLPEGEKDADNLTNLGFTATTNVFGAGKWRDEYSETLRGKDVIVFGDVGDKKREGEKHTAQVLASLSGKAKSLKHVTLPDGFHDISDYITSLEREQEPREAIAHIIWRLIEETPLWTPSTEPSVSESDDEAIARLAALPVLEYERHRKEEAEKLGCREAVLDKLVDEKRPKNRNNSGLQGNAVQLLDVEPWPEPVDGAQVLDEIAETFTRYVVLPDGAAYVCALLCAHTHVVERFLCTPRLNVRSALARCGKTTLRDTIELFVSRGVPSDNLTNAVIFRLVHAHKPVILADEYDTWLPENQEMRGLLNSGHRRSKAKVLRCEGDGNELRAFNTFAPVMLCGIGALPGTLHDRSIVLHLERKKAGEICFPFDPENIEREQELCRKLARWCADNRERFPSNPRLPEGMFNRLADNWRPLFAIAEIAGDNWLHRCADAYNKLTMRDFEDVESIRTMLLTDIRKILTGEWPLLAEGEEPIPVERIFSKTLVDQLNAMADRPWPEARRGKPISEQWLAKHLANFRIHSKTVRIGEERAKGYYAHHFSNLFARYLPQEEGLSRDAVTYEAKPVFRPVTKNENVTAAKMACTEGNVTCHALKGGIPENEGVNEADKQTKPVIDELGVGRL